MHKNPRFKNKIPERQNGRLIVSEQGVDEREHIRPIRTTLRLHLPKQFVAITPKGGIEGEDGIFSGGDERIMGLVGQGHVIRLEEIVFRYQNQNGSHNRAQIFKRI